MSSRETSEALQELFPRPQGPPGLSRVISPSPHSSGPATAAVPHSPCSSVSTGASGGRPEPPPAAKPFPHHVLPAVRNAARHALQPRLAAAGHPHTASRGGRVQREAQQQLPISALQLRLPRWHRLQQPEESQAGLPHRPQPERREQQAVSRQRQQPGGSGKAAAAGGTRVAWGEAPSMQGSAGWLGGRVGR